MPKKTNIIKKVEKKEKKEKRIDNFDFKNVKARAYAEETDSDLWARAFSLGYELTSGEKEKLIKELQEVYKTALLYAIVSSTHEKENERKNVALVVPYFVNVEEDLPRHKEVTQDGIGLIVFKQKDIFLRATNIGIVFCPEFLLCKFPDEQMHFNYTKSRPTDQKPIDNVLDVSTLLKAIEDVK